jgi:transcriptional regulator with PAS, ATPase and Fis domain
MVSSSWRTGGPSSWTRWAISPLELQPKLLRALESKTIRRVGAQATRQVDVRVIGAAHVDLAAAVGKGEFREDLFYRLNVVALTLPPLRHRGDDVELLAETFVTQLARRYGLPVPPLTPEARNAVRVHRWPGNIRKLRNSIERALVLSPPGTLRADELGLVRGEAMAGGGSIPFPGEL